MGDRFEVQLEALHTFAGTSTRRRDRFHEVIAKLEAARVGRESFGKMPSSGDIYNQYQDRVHSCMDDLKELAESMLDIADMAKNTAEAYEAFDSGIADGFTDLRTQGLDMQSIPSMKGSL